MTVQIISKEDSAGSGCDFSEYKKDLKEVGQCGCEPVCKMSGYFICIDHVADALKRNPGASFLGKKVGKAKPLIINGVADFIYYCKKEMAERNGVEFTEKKLTQKSLF